MKNVVKRSEITKQSPHNAGGHGRTYSPRPSKQFGFLIRRQARRITKR